MSKAIALIAFMILLVGCATNKTEVDLPWYDDNIIITSTDDDHIVTVEDKKHSIKITVDTKGSPSLVRTILEYSLIEGLNTGTD
jgi:hypothetical protein